MRGVMRTGLTVNHEGHPIGSLYGYQAIGYFTSAEDVANSPKQIGNIAAGDIKYQDQNGDGKIDAADEIIIQYGGSMKADNAAALLAKPDVDGGLIGGAALKVETFEPICKTY